MVVKIERKSMHSHTIIFLSHAILVQQTHTHSTDSFTINRQNKYLQSNKSFLYIESQSATFNGERNSCYNFENNFLLIFLIKKK